MKRKDPRDNPDQSLSFLLRVWPEGSPETDQPLSWRYSLKDLATRAQRGFADLDSLQAYLEKMEGEANSSTEGSATREGEY